MAKTLCKSSAQVRRRVFARRSASESCAAAQSAGVAIAVALEHVQKLCSKVINNKSGLLLYTDAGQAAAAFQGGLSLASFTNAETRADLRASCRPLRGIAGRSSTWARLPAARYHSLPQFHLPTEIES